MSLSHRLSPSYRTMEKMKSEREQQRGKRGGEETGTMAVSVPERTPGREEGGVEEWRVWPNRAVWKSKREREWTRETAGGMNKPSSAHLRQAQPYKDGPVPQKGEKTNTTHPERSASEPLLYTPLFPGYPTPPEAGLMDIPAIFSPLSSLSGDCTSTWTTVYKDHRGPLEEKDPLRQAQRVYRCVYIQVWTWQTVLRSN